MEKLEEMKEEKEIKTGRNKRRGENKKMEEIEEDIQTDGRKPGADSESFPPYS